MIIDGRGLAVSVSAIVDVDVREAKGHGVRDATPNAL
jgi:hypothetical protein